MEIDAVLFDVFGTLVDWRSSVARDVEDLLVRRRGEGLDPAAFADAWRSRYQLALSTVRRGERPFVRLDVLHREMLEDTLRAHGCAPLHDDEQEWLADAWCRLEPWPDVVSGLERLRHHVLLAALSNGSVGMMARLARHADLRWHAILGAEPVGAYKPDPLVYTTAAAWLDVERPRCLMVAAHAADCEAAAALGFATAFLRRPHEFGIDGTVEDAPVGTTVVVDSLETLAEAAGC